MRQDLLGSHFGQNEIVRGSIGGSFGERNAESAVGQVGKRAFRERLHPRFEGFDIVLRRQFAGTHQQRVLDQSVQKHVRGNEQPIR